MSHKTNVQPANIVPLDEILSVARVRQITSLSRTAIWEASRNGTMPAPIRLTGKRIGFRASEINAWLRTRPRAA